MARSTPRIVGNTLTIANHTSEQTLVVQSDAWFAWLRHAQSFAYANDGATFTARKQQRRSSWYWYAFTTRNGKVKSCYLGRSSDLTLERLEKAAKQLHPISAPDGVAARVYGSHSPKAIAAPEQLQRFLDEKVPAVDLSNITAFDLQNALEQCLKEQHQLSMAETVHVLELMHQVLATYRRDVLKQAALAQAQRDAIHNRPFPPPTSGGELF